MSGFVCDPGSRHLGFKGSTSLYDNITYTMASRYKKKQMGDNIPDMRFYLFLCSIIDINIIHYWYIMYSLYEHSSLSKV